MAAKDKFLRVRISEKMLNALLARHPKHASKVVRGLIQMYLNKKITKVEYTETESYS